MESHAAAGALEVRAALREAMARLRRAEIPSHTLTAELLLMHALGRERTWLYTHPEETVEGSVLDRYFDLVAQRITGTPTQYLTGKQEFWGLEFEVTPAVLIPRPETEHVVEVALERIGRRPVAGMRIADVGTGSGCLAVALARELLDAHVVATDISPAALEVAKRNAARHGVAARIEFIACNLLDVFIAEAEPSMPAVGAQPRSFGAAPVLRFDLIVSNPPYVARREAAKLPREVGGHEPPHALFGGEQGSEMYPALVEQAAKLLAPGRCLVVELGYNTLERVRALFEAREVWTRVCVTNDLAGIPRVIAAERR
jgi:release factor glutamine methyltransferase